MIDDTHMTDTASEFVTVDAVTVTEKKSRGGVTGKRFQELLYGPFRAGRISHVEMDDPSPLVSQNDEDKEDPERRRGHREEVNGDQVPNMVIEKRPPALRWRLSVPDHVLGNGGLGDIESKFEKFTVVSRGAPADIGGLHLADGPANVWVDAGSSDASALPAPIVPESLAMPPHNGIRMQSVKHGPPAVHALGERNPKQTVERCRLRPFARPL